MFRGYVVIERCWSHAECNWIGDQVGNLNGAGTRCLLDRDWCRMLAAQIKVRMVKEIPEIASLVAVQCTYFNKSASNNWLVSYHQDRSVPVTSSGNLEDWPGWSHKEGMTFIHGPGDLLTRMIAVRLHLDDSTCLNGPLKVIPNSHCFGILSTKQIEELKQDFIEETLTVSRGGVIALRPLLLHASSKSRSESSRRVLHFLFAPSTPPVGLQWQWTV